MANRAPDPIIGDNEENAAHVVAVDNLTITEAFDSSDAFMGLLTRLSFPNNAITVSLVMRDCRRLETFLVLVLNNYRTP